MELAEVKTLRLSLGVTRMDRSKNEHIRGTEQVGRIGAKVREARLRWFGHVPRRDSEYISRKMLKMEQPGRRQKRRFMDVVREVTQIVGVKEEDAEDRQRWRRRIHLEREW